MNRFGDGDYIIYLHADERKWRVVLEAFESIHENASSVGIESLVSIQPPIPAQSWQDYRYGELHTKVAAAVRDIGFEVFDLYDTLAQHPPTSLRVSPADNHANTDAHRLIAEALLPEVSRRLDVLGPDAR